MGVSISLLTITLIAGMAILVPFLPAIVYPKELRSFSVTDDLPALSAGMTVVITGANSGVGLATVEHLVEAGTANIVIMACRNMTRCQAAKDQVVKKQEQQQQQQREKGLSSSPGPVTLVPMELDLASRRSIHEFAKDLQQLAATLPSTKDDNHVANDNENQDSETIQSSNVFPIHVLINNAGVMGPTSRTEYDNETNIETHIHVNHLGHVLLTHLLWKNLLAAERARIVLVSSLAATGEFQVWKDWFRPLPKDTMPFATTWLWESSLYHAFDGIRYYCRSKKANLQFAAELHHQYAASSSYSLGTISTVASHPGMTRTHLMVKGWKWKIFPQFVKDYVHTSAPFIMTPSEGALTQVRAAFDVDGVPSGALVGPKFWLVGDPVVVGHLDGKSIHHKQFTREESRALWQRSLELLGISEFGKV